jgi:hypothetical protein
VDAEHDRGGHQREAHPGAEIARHRGP